MYSNFLLNDTYDYFFFPHFTLRYYINDLPDECEIFELAVIQFKK